MSAQTQSVQVQYREHPQGIVARVTIANEGKLNTLNSALMTDLAAALDGLAAMERLRAVVLASAGTKAFIGGADITEMVALTQDTGRAFITRIHAVCAALRRIPVPVIARIQGFTFGAGLEVAAACDLRIAADTALFGMPEVKLGIPSVVEAALLPMLIGWGRTRKMLLLGETMGAAEALQVGLVEHIAPMAVLDADLDSWLASLLASGPLAIRAQKKLILDWEYLDVPGAVQAGIDAFAKSWTTAEPRRAMQHFLDAQAARKRGG
jgi:enoyl-CoA hydratase/carnithine racemase